MRSLFHWDQTDQKNQRNQINEINQTDQIDFKIELAQFKPPSLLATEDEVKKFFNDYVNYYNRKDAKSILSLFSSKAIQNQKDGLQEIRKIYADFFSEDQELRYSLHDMKIEIYQNAVEVKVRYEIEQIVKETGEKEVWRGPIRWVLIKEDGKLKILSMDYKYHRPL
jgi:ketosteroid isomerase-like protein